MFGNLSLFQDSLPGMELCLYLFCLFFLSFMFFSYLLLKTMGCFSGCLMSSAGIQKLFCGIYSAFKCFFDEFMGEKVVSLSCSSAILGLPPGAKSITFEHSTLTIFNLGEKKELQTNLQLNICFYFVVVVVGVW